MDAKSALGGQCVKKTGLTFLSAEALKQRGLKGEKKDRDERSGGEKTTLHRICRPYDPRGNVVETIKQSRDYQLESASEQKMCAGIGKGGQLPKNLP